ncbi:MAG: yveL 1 [Planctomycetota bacterium]|nr:yveL 1 [Planctomycetota bacterium]
MWSLDRGKSQNLSAWTDRPPPVHPGDTTPTSPAVHPSPVTSARFSDSPKSPDPLVLLRALRRRWRLAVLGGVSVAILAGVATYLLVPASKYKARSLIYVAEKPPKYLYETRENLIAYRTYQETQTTLISSRKVLGAALDEAAPAQLATLRDLDDPFAWLSDRIKVDFPRGSEILTISMTGDNPKDMAAIVNHVTDAYLTLIVDEERKERLSRFERLKELSGQYQRELRKKRETFRNLAEAVGSNDKQNIAAIQQTATDHLFQIRQELLKLQSEIRQSRIQTRDLEAELRTNPNGLNRAQPAEVPLENDQRISDLQAQLSKRLLQLKRTGQMVRNGRDPAVTNLTDEVAAIRRAIENRRTELRLLVEANQETGRAQPDKAELHRNRIHIKTLEDEEKLLKEQHNTLVAELRSLNVKSVDSQWIQDEIQVANEVAKTVATEVEAVKVELDAPPRIRLIERASVPGRTDPTRRLKICGGAALAMMACFLGLISFYEFRSRRIDTVHEVEQGLGIRLIGSLPAIPRRSLGRPAHIWRSIMIESIDSARTMLLHASRSENLRVVMITSAMKGEGKTSLACHLATSLARSGRRTLLLDCDLRNPSTHRVLDACPRPGLCEALRGELPLANVVQSTAVSGLSLIAAGFCDSAALAALAQGDLGCLIDGVKEQFDLILVDSAPLLLVNDSLMIVQHVDAVLFSILLEISRVPLVDEAYQRLRTLDVRMLGAVVSGTRNKESYHYYYEQVSLESPPSGGGL